MGNSDSRGLLPECRSWEEGRERAVYPTAGGLGASVRAGGQEGYHRADFVGTSV